MAIKGFVITIIVLILLLLLAFLVIFFLLRGNKNKNVLNQVSHQSSLQIANQISGKTLNSSRYLIIDDLYQKDWFEKKKSLFENVEIVFDCGAYIGEWTSMMTNIFPLAKFYCFEPTQSSFERMIQLLSNQKQSISFENILLGEQDGKRVTFFQSLKNCDLGNSIFKENTEHFKELSKDYINVTKVTKRLDTYLKESNIKKIDLLKLDTQGSELLILKGLGDEIKNVRYIIIEVSNLNYNDSSPDFIKMIKFLWEHNFSLYDILQLHYYNDILCQMNLIFVRNDFSHLKSVNDILSH